MGSTQDLHREASQSTLSVHVEAKHEPVSTATPLLDVDHATLVPQGWPTSPSSIKRPMFTMLLHGVFDIALFAFSACFLVFSLVVMHYNDTPTSENPTATSILTRATKYGPTVFPLLFASVIGRATHAILLWRLENGERIEILDTLATSTSLTSTVSSQIQLRQISILSVVLVVVWALSPVGGQASIRQMSIENAIVSSNSTFLFTVPDGNLDSFDPVFLADSMEGDLPFVPANGLFTGALFAPLNVRASPVDVWGNVKIPKIERFEGTRKSDSDGWYETETDDDDLASYASFVGIPVDGMQSTTISTDYSFPIQSSYIQLTCTSMDTYITPENDTIPPDAQSRNGSLGIVWWTPTDSQDRLYDTLETLRPFNFTRVPEWPFYTTLNCMMTSSYVETEISCAANTSCRAVKVRRSQLTQFPPGFTIMDISLNWEIFIETVLSLPGPQTMPTGQMKDNLLDRYLLDPSLSVQNGMMGGRVPERLPSDEDYSDRLGQFLNSYLACMNDVFTLTGGINDNTSYSWDSNHTFVPPLIRPDEDVFFLRYDWSSEYTPKSRVWLSEGFKHEHMEAMVAHKPWAITLSIASLVLIAFSLVPPLVRHFLTAGPDIAMNFSSLATRNNTHVPIPASGSFLPASDRFRLLKDLRLRFTDAEGKSEVGNLVIAAQGVEKAGYSRVRKGRLYE